MAALTRVFFYKKMYDGFCQAGRRSSDLAFRQKLCYHYLVLRLERKQKNSSNPFRIGIFLSLSYSFWIETVNTFIHSRSSLENHTRFETKMGKAPDTRFQTKTAQKPYLMGRHIPIWRIRGSSPRDVKEHNFNFIVNNDCSIRTQVLFNYSNFSSLTCKPFLASLTLF